MKKILLAVALTLVLAAGPLAQNAQAWVGVRLGIGIPLYVGPGPYYYGYPYYYPPTYVAPAPTVVYQAAPPTVVGSSPATTEALPPPQFKAPLSTAPAANASQPSANVIPASSQVPPQVDAVVRQLGDASDTVRRDAAIQLGRLKALNAVDALVNVLSKDSSPIARDGAARGLGLIASPRSLNALIYAAQADNDRDVRHSAQFSVEVIRSNMRGNP